MKKFNFFLTIILCITISGLMIGCNNESKESTDASKSANVAATSGTNADMSKIKAEIQALETSWSKADNARDTNAVAAFYADDAITMSNNRPSISGKDEIRKDVAVGLTKRKKGATVAYDVMDVFGCENTVTETGKITLKDSTGTVYYTGKYMAVWEKRDGKYICVRDISNDDKKEK